MATKHNSPEVTMFSAENWYSLILMCPHIWKYSIQNVSIFWSKRCFTLNSVLKSILYFLAVHKLFTKACQFLPFRNATNNWVVIENNQKSTSGFRICNHKCFIIVVSNVDFLLKFSKIILWNVFYSVPFVYTLPLNPFIVIFLSNSCVKIYFRIMKNNI